MSLFGKTSGSAVLVFALAAFAAPADARTATDHAARSQGGSTIMLATSCKDRWYTMSGIQYLTCLFSGQLK